MTSAPDLSPGRAKLPQATPSILTGRQWLGRRGNPAIAVTLGLLLFAAAWLAHLSYTSLSPPTDNIEQLNWVNALEWGYYKHPPLPTWLIWLPVQLFGANAWTSYVAGAALTLGSMGLLWWLVAQLRGRRFATLALLAVLCISYYNARLYAYNHNIVLMLLSTLSAAFCWKACDTGRQRWWSALGVVLGLGMLTKYQIAVTMTSVFVYWLSQRGWRDFAQRRGLLSAALIALLMFVPHLLWLRTHDFGPIQYAVDSALGARLSPLERLLESSNWLADQLLNRALAAWVLLATVVVYLRRYLAMPVRPPHDALEAPRDEAGRALLLSWGLVPLLFMPLVCAAGGSILQMQWGAPFMLFAVPAAMELTSRWVQWWRWPLRAALTSFVIIQLLLLTASHLTSGRGPIALRDQHWRSFDSRALARELELKAQGELRGRPICIISGPTALAGALALQLSDHPLVLIDGRKDRSPWIKVERPLRCGTIQLQQGLPLPGGKPVGAQFPDLWWRVLGPEASAPVVADAEKQPAPRTWPPA